MTNRLALVGAIFAAISAACPSVAVADNPWRSPQTHSGGYMTPPAPTPAPDPLPTTPEYLPNLGNYPPLDGRLHSEEEAKPAAPPVVGVYPGYANPYGYGGAYGLPHGYGGTGLPYGYGGTGLPYGYGGTPYLGGLGYPGGLGGGYPYSGGLWPGLGGLNSGPLNWMPFW